MITHDARKLTWENFSVAYLNPGIPAVCPVLGKPDVHIFVEEGARRIGLRTPCAIEEEIPEVDLTAIQVRQVRASGATLLEVATSTVMLYREFYAFCLSVADEIQRGGYPPTVALSRTLRAWKQLFREAEVLTEEEQVGLLGELWFLRELIRVRGAATIAAWTGPRREAHDFRCGASEFEVKSSRTEDHTHTINGLSQLVASVGCALYVVSVGYGLAGPGAGETLSVAVAATRAMVANTVHGEELDRLLSLASYRDTDAEYYRVRWQLRGLPRVVPVDALFPRLTPALLDSLGPLKERIRDVRYELRLDGLGLESNTPQFDRTLRS